MNTLRAKARKVKYCTEHSHLYEINLNSVMANAYCGLRKYQGLQLIRAFESFTEYNFKTANLLFLT